MLKYLIWDWNGTRRRKLRSAPSALSADIRFSPLLLLSARNPLRVAVVALRLPSSPSLPVSAP